MFWNSFYNFIISRFLYKGTDRVLPARTESKQSLKDSYSRLFSYPGIMLSLGEIKGSNVEVLHSLVLFLKFWKFEDSSSALSKILVSTIIGVH